MKKEIWFKAKLFGWGWYPSTWQGWLVVLVWIAVLIAHMNYLGLLVENTLKPEFDGKMFESLILFCVYTGILIWVSYVKGENPRWRWGK